jgi:hypothetical protein
VELARSASCVFGLTLRILCLLLDGAVISSCLRAPFQTAHIVLDVYALHLSRDLAYIVDVAPINSTLCNIPHQIMISILLTRIRRIFENFR